MPVFKTAMETPSAASVSSILTRSRHLFPLLRATVALFAVVALVLLHAPRLHAQDTTLTPPRAEVPAPRDPAVGAPSPAAGRIADSLSLRTSPMNAFWRSFLLPGWGQAKLGRKLTAGLFLAWEGTTLGMSLKTRRELGYLRRTGSLRAEDKRREHEDWLVLLAFNHLFAGLEAYVSGHLTDFPGDLRLQAVPGGVGASVSVPFRLR